MNDRGSFKSDIDWFTEQAVNKAVNTLQKLSKYEQSCKEKGLHQSKKAVFFMRKQLMFTISFLKDLQKFSYTKDSSLETLIKLEAELRVAIQSVASANLYLSWRSPAYSQAVMPQFFDLNSLQQEGTLYERYGHKSVDLLEAQLLKIFSPNSSNLACTVVSSGMAAYSLIEAYLIRKVIKPHDCIVLAPCIYFESEEQLGSLQWLKIIKSKSYYIQDLISIIENNSPKVVFLDSLENTAEQQMIDIPNLLKHFENHSFCPLFIIDGSMLPCALIPYMHDFARKDCIIYMESCSKYLQFGFDFNMAGVIVYDSSLQSTLNNLRQNMGLIITEYGAHLFPFYEREQLINKLIRTESNACKVAEGLSKNSEILEFCRVIHPSLPSHPDYLLAKRLNRYGGCITLEFKTVNREQKDMLATIVDLIIQNAHIEQIPVVEGVSFGFSFPRIIGVDFDNKLPFLRIYVGDQYQLNEGFTKLIIKSFSQLKNMSL